MFIVVMQISQEFFNTWCEADGGPQTFETFEDAVVELAEFYRDYRKEVGEPDEFRIVRVEDRYTHWHDGGQGYAD